MSTQRERIEAQLEKAKENVRKLQAKEAELSRKEREQKKKALEKWMSVVKRDINDAMKVQYGADYWEKIPADEIAKLVSQAITHQEGDQP